MNFFYLTLVCFFFFVSTLRAQEIKPIHIGVTQGGFIELVKQVEEQTDYYFYYNEQDFANYSININREFSNLESLLKVALKDSSYYFSIIEQKKIVFVTKNYALKIPQSGKLIAKENLNYLNPPDFKFPLSDKFKDSSLINSNSATNERKLYVIGIAQKQNNTVNLAGKLINIKNGNPVSGAFISIDNTSINTITDNLGRYNLKLPSGEYLIRIKATGMLSTTRKVLLNQSGTLNIFIDDDLNTLEEVIVRGNSSLTNNRNQLGAVKLNIKDIRQIPSIFGEADVLKVLLTQPGVQTVGEASGGFNVRGGSVDQNLILFNDAVIYNPSHFFGFFSAFNPEVVSGVELFKSNIPAKYGGRLSSVLDIKTKTGNKDKFTGSAGLGLVTSRINIEGPIIKEKTSFVFGARTTYSDWLLRSLPEKSGLKNTSASFSDLNLNLHHKINNNSNIDFTSYYSKDISNLNTDTLFGYANKVLSLKWKHFYNPKLLGTLTTSYSGYSYENYSDNNIANAYELSFAINQSQVKQDFFYYLNNDLSLNFGLSAIYYQLNTGSLQPRGASSIVSSTILEKEQALESAIYLGGEYNLNKFFSVDLGLRFSRFNFLGPKTVRTYEVNQPITEDNVLETTSFNKGDNIKTYEGPEFRISSTLNVNSNLFLRASYNSLRQYIHLLSNTTAVAPTDLWKLSDLNIKPQLGSQVSLGANQSFAQKQFEVSVDAYYKRISNFLDFKSGATFILNPNVETELISTQGKAYGTEFLVKKLNGDLNGWISYTYSRVLLRSTLENGGELINNGEEFPSAYDKPHSVNFLTNYQFTKRFNVSLNLTYSTGRPITLPIAKYNYGNSQRVLYSDRNEFRIPNYFRMDLSMNLDGNHNVKKATHNFWTFGVYNLTGRNNPYSLYFNSENGRLNGYKLSIFGRMVPFVNFNIKF